MQNLVSAVELFAHENVSLNLEIEMGKLEKICAVYEPDSLILGCTHFLNIKEEIQEAGAFPTGFLSHRRGFLSNGHVCEGL